MKRTLMRCCLMIMIHCAIYAQGTKSLSVTAGVSLPNAPVQFSDYWNEGFGCSIQFNSKMTNEISWTAAGEFNYFTFDHRGFLDHFSITDKHASITGRSTRMMSGYAALEYHLPEFESITVLPFIGAGGSITTVTEGTVVYTFRSSTVPSDSKFIMIVLYGINVITPLTESLDLLFEAKKNIGLVRLSDKNTDIVSIRAGVRINVN